MLKAGLDSSVLISAFPTRGGVADQLLDAAERGAFISCLSHKILAETAAVLQRSRKLQARYGYDRAAVEAFCDGLAATAEIAFNLPQLRAVPDDPKDDMVVATAGTSSPSVPTRKSGS
jgi:putative PIN family toxin of toxin-antitoxin system